MRLLSVVSQYSPTRLDVRQPSANAIESVMSKVQDAIQNLDVNSMSVPRDILAEGLEHLSKDEILPPRLLRQMCYGGLSHAFGSNGDINFISRLLIQVEATAKSGIYQALLRGYLLIAKANDPLSDILRKFLRSKRHHFNERVASRVTEYGLLEDMPGRKLSKMIMHDQSQTPQTILAAARFNRRGEGAGFLTATFTGCCDLLSKEYSPEALTRFFEYIGKDPIFEKSILLYANALLGHWQRQESDPDEATKNVIQNFMVGQFGDPRINKVIWNDAGEAKSVLLRWLVAQSLDLMLQVLSASNDTGHWKDRAKFWRGYIKQDVVTDAWVVFGRDASQVARRMVDDEEITKGGFGKLHGGGAQSMHSVLLMRIGDLVISEWTHDGKVRFFSHGRSNTPAFYMPIYHPHLVRDDRYVKKAYAHHASWKRQVSQFIYDHTGIHNPPYVTTVAPHSPEPKVRRTPRASVWRERIRTNTATTTHCVKCEGVLPVAYAGTICIACGTNTRNR
ncbi:EH signature domain-containing protein [Oceanospirillaceae bacterium]|nr:EH signature domain-containing protein [Oceanospirillaceae bacterium]